MRSVTVHTIRIFMNEHTFVRPKQHINSIEPDFPCLGDEIAEPRPDMNIKVAAFTVSEKSINIHNLILIGVFIEEKELEV